MRIDSMHLAPSRIDVVMTSDSAMTLGGDYEAIRTVVSSGWRLLPSDRYADTLAIRVRYTTGTSARFEESTYFYYGFMLMTVP